MNQNPKFTYLLGTHPCGAQIIIVFILLGVCIFLYAQDDNQAQVVAGPDYKIVSQLVEKSATLNGRPLYTLSYSYYFHNRDKIFLQNIGNIEASGELTYLSPSKVVEFWSRDRKEKLATVEFQETAASRSGEADEMPPLKVFLPVKRKSPWPKNIPAQLNILKVVNQHYPTGAHAWMENDTQYFETLFEPLGSLPRGDPWTSSPPDQFPNCAEYRPILHRCASRHPRAAQGRRLERRQHQYCDVRFCGELYRIICGGSRKGSGIAMKKYTAQLWLLSIFLIFFAIQTALLAVGHLSNGFGAAQLKNLIVQLVTIYSIPLSVIIAGIFAKRRRTAKLDGIFYASVVLAVLWNSLFAWRTVELTLAAIGVGEDRAKDFSEYIESVSKVSTFLISGLLTSYFAKAPEGSSD